MCSIFFLIKSTLIPILPQNVVILEQRRVNMRQVAFFYLSYMAIIDFNVFFPILSSIEIQTSISKKIIEINTMA